MFCRKCGFELADDAVFCQKCGCRTDGDASVAEAPAEAPVPPVTEAPAPATTAPTPPTDAMPAVKPPKKKHRTLTVVLAIVLSVVVVIGALAIAILPRPDLEMEDFKEENIVSAIFRYGIPTAADDGCFYYYNTDITFYGVPVEQLVYDFEEESIAMHFSDDRDREDAAEELIDHCEFEEVALEVMYYFTYEDLEIIAFDYASTMLITIEW